MSLRGGREADAAISEIALRAFCASTSPRAFARALSGENLTFSSGSVREELDVLLRKCFASLAMTTKNFSVVIGEGKHPFPFRIRSLSPLPQMVLVSKGTGRV